MSSNIATKYRYLRPESYFCNLQPGYKNLCIGIRTDLTTIDSDKANILNWAVTFKAPGDQFSKEEARTVLSDTIHGGVAYGKSGTLLLKKGQYTHHEIIGKILMTLLIEDFNLTPKYRTFILKLLEDVRAFTEHLVY